MKLMSSIKSLSLILLLALSATHGKADSLGPEFLYQGLLSVNGSPASNTYEMMFTLFRQGNPTPVSSVTLSNVSVRLGVFTVELDFGAGVFDGTAYELGIAVRERAGGGQFVTLQPRQPLTATPNATHAQTVSSVADSALSPNVALLNGSPVFISGITVTTLQVRNAGGGGLVQFGSSANCTVGVDPQGPAGLLLRDPSGIRILNPNPLGANTLVFGPTDQCSLGIDPALSGLLLRDPRGIRILNPIAQGTPSLFFGPTDGCQISADPNAGVSFKDPRGFAFSSQVTVSGPVLAQDFIATSSRRFKDDVKPIEQPLEKISQLQGVGFTWNEEKGGRKDIGFIAEDVAKVIPEVVSWEEDGRNARGVNYDHLVAVAIEGIKAQQSQIRTLEREKTELKESLDAMQSKLDRLSEKLETLMVR